MDNSKSKKNPWIVIERQYRHAANQFLWELPAGKLDPGEDALAGAKRELAEETGYSAKKWKPLVEYYASPGFLGESMKVFLAEGLIAGEARPEEDEKIEFRLVRLSEVLKMIDKGAILDGKTLTSVLPVRAAIPQGNKRNRPVPLVASLSRCQFTSAGRLFAGPSHFMNCFVKFPNQPFSALSSS